MGFLHSKPWSRDLKRSKCVKSSCPVALDTEQHPMHRGKQNLLFSATLQLFSVCNNFHNSKTKFTTIFHFLLLCNKRSIELPGARKQTEKWSFLWKCSREMWIFSLQGKGVCLAWRAALGVPPAHALCCGWDSSARLLPCPRDAPRHEIAALCVPPRRPAAGASGRVLFGKP